jgi:phosphoribosyl-dephospho-CoA transferase
MPPVEFFRRHDWVWLADDWRSQLSAPLTHDEALAVEDWLHGDRPLVVARRQAGDEPDTLRLGLALPGKRRIGLCLTRAVVLRRAEGPKLAQAAVSAFPEWRNPLEKLSAGLTANGAEARVFGSFAWQYFAGDPARVYLTTSSDVDLLLRPACWSSAQRLLAFLEDFSNRHPTPRLDGEIILPDGDAVAWRELWQAPAKILTKGAGEVRLRALADVRALYRELAA